MLDQHLRDRLQHQNRPRKIHDCCLRCYCLSVYFEDLDDCLELKKTDKRERNRVNC